MSHHFDTQLAAQDPRLNVADAYLFRGAPGHTVMAMTSNADAGISAPDTFHPEGLYAFRFDTDGDARADIVFKVRFGAVAHRDGTEHDHVQPFRVLRAGPNELDGATGELLLDETTGEVQEGSGIRAFAGLVPEMWSADAYAIGAMLNAFYLEDRFEMDIYQHKRNFFARRNAMAVVLEVPDTMLGNGLIRLWGAISLLGHAPEVQVSRWGFPLFTHLFLSSWRQPLIEQYHKTMPWQDEEIFSQPIARFVSKLSVLAGAPESGVNYGASIASRLCPSLLPYTLGTDATFEPDGFNGRPLDADAFDVMVTLAAGRPVSDRVSQDLSRLRDEFPYYGAPYSAAEQAELKPIPQHGVVL